MIDRKVTYSETEPPSPDVGDIWINTTTRVEKIWSGVWEQHNHSGSNLSPNEVLLPNGFKIVPDGKHGIAIEAPSGVLYTLALKEMT